MGEITLIESNSVQNVDLDGRFGVYRLLQSPQLQLGVMPLAQQA